MSKKRFGMVRVRMGDFVTMVTLTDKLRRKAEWCAGERMRLIEACEEMQAKLRRQHEHHAATCAEVRRLTEERDAMHAAIRALDRANVNVPLPWKFAQAVGALMKFLPPDAAADTGRADAGGEETA